MSIHAIKEAFHGAATGGLRCVAARMRYCDENGGDTKRDHQILEFDIVRASDNLRTTIVTDPIKSADGLIAAAIASAAAASVKSFK